VPPGVKALGPAAQIHPPWKLIALLYENPAACVLLGLTFLFGSFVLGVVLKPQNNFPLFLTSMFGVAVLFSNLILRYYGTGVTTYAVFADALVLVRENEFTVVPWDDIKELTFGGAITTADGRSIQLSFVVQGYDRLLSTVQSRMMERMMPPILRALDAGGRVTFGLLTLSRGGVGYQDKAVPWSRVTKVSVRLARSQRALQIEDGAGLSRWCSIDLNAIPNDFLLLSVLQHVCPPRLLEAGGG
jgi:hypothetical protein